MMGKWIPVEEEMPEIRWDIGVSEEVLVTVKRKVGREIIHSVDLSRTNGYIWLDVGKGEVTAWMDMPKPYEGDKG